MQHTKPFVLLVFLLITYNGYTQKLDSLLYDYLVLDKQWKPYKIRQDTSIHTNDILEKVASYYSYPDRRSRSRAFSLTYRTMHRAKITDSIILQFLLECPCQDSEYSTRRTCFENLTTFERVTFTERNIRLFRKILYDDDLVGSYIILLAGYLNLIEDADRIRSFIEADNSDNSFQVESYAAQLALTRMGEQQYIDGILAHIENEKMYDRVIFNLKYLAYVQHDKATNGIVDILINGDKHLSKNRTEELYGKEEAEKMRTWCDSGVDSYSLRAAGVLGQILKDTPIKVGRGGAAYPQLEVARNWIENRDKNAAWIYNKNTFWAAY